MSMSSAFASKTENRPLPDPRLHTGVPANKAPIRGFIQTDEATKKSRTW
jgi:hypothetical protein